MMSQRCQWPVPAIICSIWNDEVGGVGNAEWELSRKKYNKNII